MKFAMHIHSHDSIENKSFMLAFYQVISGKAGSFLSASKAMFKTWLSDKFHEDDFIGESSGWRNHDVNSGRISSHVSPRTWRRHSALLSSWEEQKRSR